MPDINALLNGFDLADIARRLRKNSFDFGNDRCQTWTGSTNGDGYGRIGFIPLVGGAQIKHAAHRVAWVLDKGPIPPNLHVLHHCDNRGCIKTTHMYLGDNKQNAADMVRRNRQGDSTPKLNSREKAYIRKSKKPVAQLARKFKVTRSAIYLHRDPA